MRRLVDGALSIDECWDLAENAEAIGLILLEDVRPILRRLEMHRV